MGLLQETDMEEKLSLQWNNYQRSMTDRLKVLVDDEDFVDVTLHSEGQTLKAHKVYLSACSAYFKTVLKGTNLWQHPILFLTNVPFGDLQKILEFVYRGEVQVTQQDLSSFLKSAEILQISGLIEKHASNESEAWQSSLSSTGPLGSIFRKDKNARKKRRRESKVVDAVEQENSNTTDCDTSIQNNELNNSICNASQTALLEPSEQVIVKADPEDFPREECISDVLKEDGDHYRGIVIRNDLTDQQTSNPPFSPPVKAADQQLYGERGRCHFCSLLCPDRVALTLHLKEAHQPQKHALCDNCENFFHICAIQRHKQKCKARYQTEHR